MIYDYEAEKLKKKLKGKLVLIGILLLLIVSAVIAGNIYLEIIQLDEIGGLSRIYLINLTYKIIFSIAVFLVIFLAASITSIFIRKNLKHYFTEKGLQQKKLPVFSIAAAIALVGAFITQNLFYQKALIFMNAGSFGKEDPIFFKDIGYYIFQRPFLMAIYEFASSLWLFIIIYTALYYFLALAATFGTFSMQDLKVKSILRHNLINIAVFFLIKIFSYKFLMEGILYSNVLNVKGAGYIDVNVWQKYFTAAPFLILVIIFAALAFIWKGKLKRAAYTIAIFPAVWLIVTVISFAVQSLVVTPNEFNLESPYLMHNIEKTREAYNLDKIRNYQFPNIQELTPEIINRNIETKNNIRVVDYESTLTSNVQLQSNTLFYTFVDGDIINYTINGKETPVFITAREINKNTLKDKTYLNMTYKYTHGYGVVINPINRLTSGGQVDFILSDLRLKSVDKALRIDQPRIYYGELTKDHVIVNASNNLNEIDYDGNSETRYEGKGGIRLNLLNRLLFSIKYADLQMITSGYASNARLLLNREIVGRAQRAVPFLTVDKDPYILLTTDGRLKWVLDAYTTSSNYPYAQNYGQINYIRNSVKIVIDAYDGTIKYYIIDKNDPIIKTYNKIYPGVFSEEPLPADIASHMRYPETLFKVQTDLLKRYHLESKDVSTFYGQQDLWDIAKYSVDKTSNTLKDIDPYYNMIRLPGDIGETEELVLMRPFTPSGELKHNMVSWLSVRNSHDNYGEMILFNFPKNMNIFGPNQVEVKINQIDKVSKDMTLWGQSGSDVYKGSLLVIPIENSILYIEPIYIRAVGGSSIPEVREIVVGYQSGDEFKYGIGTNLDEALNSLFAGIAPTPVTPQKPAPEEEKAVDEKLLDELTDKFEALKKQLDDLGNLINELKK